MIHRRYAVLLLALPAIISCALAQNAPTTAPTSRPTTRRTRVLRQPVHYYVAPTGSDTATGTQERPFASIQKAADELLPGDVVHIAEGVYKERIVLHKSGTYLGRPIRIEAMPGANVVIDAQGLTGPGRAAFDTAGQDHLIIAGITVQNSNGWGIGVNGSWQVTLDHCRSLSSEASGIMVDKSGMVQVTDCEVTKACRNGEESISVKRSQDVSIAGTHIHHTGHEGIDVKEGSKHVRVSNCEIDHVERQGLYAEAWDSPTFDIRFENNTVHDCGFGVAAGSECGGELSDVWFINNLVYANNGPGMITADWGGRYAHPVRDIHFLHNTVVGNGRKPSGWDGGMVFENTAAREIEVAYNVLVDNGIAQIRISQNKAPASAKIHDNLLFGNGEPMGDNTVVAEAKFVNAAERDYRLQPDSPAMKLNAGWRPVIAPTTAPAASR